MIKLFLDYDGVLNSFHQTPNKDLLSSVTGFDDWKEVLWPGPDFVSNDYWPVCHSPERDSMVRDLAKQCDFVWATTWLLGNNLYMIQDLVGVEGRRPVLDVNQRDLYTLHESPWKQETVEHETEPDELFIWADDDAISDRFFLDKLNTAALFRPDSRFGLSRSDLELMQKVIDTRTLESVNE